jgi:error-prone DNA polymerase
MTRALEKTLGVPLFQEQLMQLAMDSAGFSPLEADKLRRAMGSKRSVKRMEEMRERLYQGMAANGITGELADDLYVKLCAFANYGFPESHAISFAILVYVSAWVKWHHPEIFCASLLNSQPMGFYQPAQLVRDAREHGVEVLAPDILASGWDCTLEPPSAPFMEERARRFSPRADKIADYGNRPRWKAVRLGFRQIKGLKEKADIPPLLKAREEGARTPRPACRNGRWSYWPRPTPSPRWACRGARPYGRSRG